MTPVDDSELEHGGDDALAAEYVLGVLPAEERQAMARRVETEPVFARLVEAWQGRLAPLDADFEEVSPPAALKRSLDARLFSGEAAKSVRPNIWQSLALWRLVSAAAVAALLLVLALPLFQEPTAVGPSERLVASLAAEGTDVRYLAVYDGEQSEVALSHVTGARDAGRDFELWVIEGDNPPASLGVIPVGASVQLAVPPELRDQIESGDLFAISLEPAGGSPTGQPTGPVVAAGDLRTI